MIEDAAHDADTLDLVVVCRTAWAHRLRILIAALLCAVVGFVVGMIVITSRAESFLQLSYTMPAPVSSPTGMPAASKADQTQSLEKAEKDAVARLRTTIAEYKVLNARTLSRHAFVDYASKRKLLEPALIAGLDRELARDNALTRWMRPVFAVGRADLLMLPDFKPEEENYLVGIAIGVDRRSPQQAISIAIAVGEFVRDSAILLRARELASSLSYAASGRLLSLDRQMVATRLQLSEAEQRQKELAAIRQRYPEAARGDVRQVIAVDPETSRFLPPVVQLVGIESKIAEHRGALRVALWETERATALLAFLTPAEKIIETAYTGTDLFQALDVLMSATFTPERMQSDSWRDAADALNTEVGRLKTLYFGPMRLISLPALNEIPLRLRLLPALIGLIVGAILATAILLLRGRFERTPARAV